MQLREKVFFPEKPYFVKKPPTSVTVKEKEMVTLPCEANGFPQPVEERYKVYMV